MVYGEQGCLLSVERGGRMSRYIDADEYLHELEELIRARLDWRSDGRNEIQGLDVAICELENQPTADVVEVKRGEWIDIWEDNSYNKFCKCSVCDRWSIKQYASDMNYCPNCGARMVEE